MSGDSAFGDELGTSGAGLMGDKCRSAGNTDGEL